MFDKPTRLRQINAGGERGSITFPQYNGAPVTIRLGRDADRSTFVHEMAHLYFWHLRNLSTLDTVQNSAAWDGPQARWNSELIAISRWWEENAEEIAKQAGEYAEGLSAEGFREWLASGMERESAAGAAYERAAQEYFARGFEKYLAEGKAPSKDLLSVFRRFKKWLCEIYRTLTRNTTSETIHTRRRRKVCLELSWKRTPRNGGAL